MANTTVKVIRTFGTSDGFKEHQEGAYCTRFNY